MKMQTLTVAMNGEVVGTLYRDNKGAMSFQYAPEWIRNQVHAPFPCHCLWVMAGSQEVKSSISLATSYPTQRQLLPWMQARFRVETTHPFDLLASVGRDCVGAIQLYSPDADIPTVMETLAEPLDEAQIEQLLEGYRGSAPWDGRGC